MSNARTEVVLGYGGGAKIDGVSVFITSGNINQNVTEPTVLPFDMPHTHSPRDGDRFNIALGPGIYAYSGSIAFDFTLEAVEKLITKDFLSRNKEFEIIIHNGHKAYTLQKCKWGSFTISVTPNSLVTGNISFQATNNEGDDPNVINPIETDMEYIFDEELLAYWHTGNEEIESFDLSLNQGLTPVYLNGNLNNPAYIRGGAITGEIQVNAWETWLEHTSVQFAGKTIKFAEYLKETMEFTYGGPAATGMHNYTVTIYGEENSSKQILEVY